LGAVLRVTSCPSWFIVLSMPVAENIARIRERMKAAASRAGRNVDDITLMAVSKTVSPDLIRAAHLAGVRVFGENRVQEFAEKAGALRDLSDARWHMIGHLQTNKATKAAELFAGVDSIDSLRLAQKLNSAAQQAGKKLAALIEINVGGEAAKTGVAPESPELEKLLQAAPSLDHLEIRGLMTIPPLTDDPQEARPYFRKLRELQKQIRARALPGVSMNVLSMGMSHDFEIAIEEGSTCVRVGTAIFGQRAVT
jgi:pyridoxal phosphate enzyme (YggS family)